MEHNISLLDPHEPVLNPSSKSILVPKLNHILFSITPSPSFFFHPPPPKNSQSASQNPDKVQNSEDKAK